MSSISFSAQGAHALVSGRERANMSTTCADFLLAQISTRWRSSLDWLPYVLAPDHYLQVGFRAAQRDPANWQRFASDVSTFLRVADGNFCVAGEQIDIFSLQLNSALQWGNDGVRLAAKLHGQCEIHAFCEADNRPWLADRIDEGIDAGVLRDERWGYDGWSAVKDLLLNGPDGPIVTSYSVCDGFPGPHCAPADMDLGDDPWARWGQLSAAEQWRLGMEHIRAEPGLQISPDRLANRFGDHRLSGLDLVRRARKLMPQEEAA